MTVNVEIFHTMTVNVEIDLILIEFDIYKINDVAQLRS